MSSVRRRTRAASSIAACAVLVLALLGWLGVLRVHQHSVAMPANDAAPAQVVATWAHAVDERDCATAAALWIDPHNVGDGGTCGAMRTFQLLKVVNQSDLGMTRDLTVEVDEHLLPFHENATLSLRGWTGLEDVALQKDPSGAWRITAYGLKG